MNTGEGSDQVGDKSLVIKVEFDDHLSRCRRCSILKTSCGDAQVTSRSQIRDLLPRDLSLAKYA